MGIITNESGALEFTSTGAVEFDPTPETRTNSVDNSSTGAVEYSLPQGTPVVTDNSAVQNVPNPGPVTMSVSWLPEVKAAETPEVETKVITPAPKAKPKTSKPATVK